MTRALCLSVAAVLTVAVLHAEPPKSKVFETKIHATNLEPGTGSELREKLLMAIDLQEKAKLAEAEKLFDTILADFEKRMTDPDTLYISLANKKELEAFQKENPGKKVVWFDYTFGETIYRKTFLAAARKNYPEALKLADRGVKYRPYAAVTFTERGFVLNQTGKPKEGLEAYRRALALAERFESSRSSQAMALRGMGFALIELRQLKEARAAFEKSLVLEPMNKLALSELDYIRKLEEKEK